MRMMISEIFFVEDTDFNLSISALQFWRMLNDQSGIFKRKKHLADKNVVVLDI